MNKIFAMAVGISAVLLFSVLVFAQSSEDENPNVLREALVCGFDSGADFFAEFNFETGIISSFADGELESYRTNQTEESFWTLVRTNRELAAQDRSRGYREGYIQTRTVVDRNAARGIWCYP